MKPILYCFAIYGWFSIGRDIIKFIQKCTKQPVTYKKEQKRRFRCIRNDYGKVIDFNKYKRG